MSYHWEKVGHSRRSLGQNSWNPAEWHHNLPFWQIKTEITSEKVGHFCRVLNGIIGNYAELYNFACLSKDRHYHWGYLRKGRTFAWRLRHNQ